MSGNKLTRIKRSQMPNLRLISSVVFFLCTQFCSHIICLQASPADIPRLETQFFISRLVKIICVYFHYNRCTCVNPLNPELNSICYLLALLGAHHFLHVSRIRVKLLTFRLLMSYIHMEHLFLMFLDHTQRRTTVGRTPLDE